MGLTSVPAPVQEPWPASRTAWYSIFVLILSLTFAQLDLNIAAYVAANIKADLKLTDTQLGLLLGASFGLFYTLVGVPLAWFVDRYSRKVILTLGIVTWSLGTAFCGVAQNYWQLFVARFFVGAGEAVNGPASYSIVADLFPRARLPRAIAVMQTGTVIGPAIGLLISAYLLHVFLDMRPIEVPFGVIYGWQLVFIMVGVPGVLVGLLIMLTMPEPARRGLMRNMEAQPSGLAAWFADFALSFKYMGKHWSIYGPMFIGLAFGMLVSGGTLQWKPIFFLRTFGWSAAQLAALNAVVTLVLTFAGLAVGVWLAERYEKRGRADAPYRVFIISRVIALPCSMAAPLVPNAWLSLLLMGFGIAASIGMGSPSQNAVIQTITPNELRGKITALWLLIYSVVGFSLGPVLVALITDYILKDESQIRWAIFWVTAVFGTLSLAISWLGMKPYAQAVALLKVAERDLAKQ